MTQQLIGYTWNSSSEDCMADCSPYEAMDEVLAFPSIVYRTAQRALELAAAEYLDMFADDEDEDEAPVPMWNETGEPGVPPTYEWWPHEGRCVIVRPVFLEDEGDTK
jgi:hypothetical protein